MTAPHPLADPPSAPGVLPEEEVPRRLSEDLRAILVQAAGRAITIGEIEGILRGRGVAGSIMVGLSRKHPSPEGAAFLS